MALVIESGITGYNIMNMEKVEEGVRYLLQNYSMAEADMISSTVQDILAEYLDRQLSQDTEE